MPKKTDQGEKGENTENQEIHERVVILNIAFLEFAILVGCLEAAKQPFIQRIKDGFELQGIEQPTLDMIVSLDNLVHEQAKISTSHLGAERVVRELDRLALVNETFAATYTKVLQEDLVESIKRAKGK